LASLHGGVAISVPRLFVGVLREHELLLVVLEESRASLHVHEQVVHFANVFFVDFGGLTLHGDEVGSRDEMDGVTERALLANLC